MPSEKSDENTLVIPVSKPRDPIARDLLSPKYRLRRERIKKGKGSFKRKKDIDNDELI